jgi:hypothetical protein
MLSRNSASSRAIPVEKQIARVLDDPFIPEYWGANQAGMQASTELDAEQAAHARVLWLRNRDRAVLGAVAFLGGLERVKDDALRERLRELEAIYQLNDEPLGTPLHKQIASRGLEPYMYHTVVVTATDWSNFFALRDNREAQPEIQRAAHAMRQLLDQHRPTLLREDEWHLPFIQEDERHLPVETLARMAVARCARVSYLTHDTAQRDPQKDLALYQRLVSSGHMSPLEHVARPMTDAEYDPAHPYLGNFRGWVQLRKTVPHEDDFSQIAPA